MFQDQVVIQMNVEDKVIWMVMIDNGVGWRNKFMFFKIVLVLIWVDFVEWFDFYSGLFVIEEGNVFFEKLEMICEIFNDLIEQQ